MGIQINGTTDVISAVDGSLTVSGADLSNPSSLNVSGIGTLATLVVTGNASIGGTITYQDVAHVDAVGIITAQQGLQVLANGLDVTGVSTFNDNVYLGDSDVLNFGAGSDLQISHDGSNSFINDYGEGSLFIRGTNLYIQGATAENAIRCIQDGAVTLYHDASEKLATTSGGIDVTGTVTCDGLQCDGNASISSGTGVLELKDSDSTGSNNINYVKGVDSAGTTKWLVGDTSGADTLYVRNAANGWVSFWTNDAQRIIIQEDGHMRPDADSTYDLGTNSIRFRNVYADTLYGDGSQLSGISVGLTTESASPNNTITHLDLTNAQDHKLIVSGITTISVTGGTEADSHTIRIQNSGISTVGFSTYFLFPSGAAPTLPTADGAISLISFTVHRVGAAGTQLLAGASVNFS